MHRIAARLDDRFELVAGALSSTPEKARASGAELGLDDDRNYGSYEEMVESEARREDGIEAVAIVTPNATHLPVARAFLEHGIHVICDKPMTATLADAEELAALAETSGRLFVLTHNYSGYPMIRQAREMVAAGELGALRAYGERGGLDWRQESPDDLWYTRHGEPPQRLRRGGAGANAAATRVTRIPAGHPEGYLEAFATLYREAADAILAAREGKTPGEEVTFPSLDDGIQGMAFVEACVRSSNNGTVWVEV